MNSLRSHASSSKFRPRRSYSQSPTRTAMDDDDNISLTSPPSASPSKPVRRGRKPTSNKRSGRKESIDYDSSFHNSSSMLVVKDTSSSTELDFLSKSPAGHQWRNKKHWQSNANATQRRYQEYSGKSYTMTPQGMEREMRRKDIRASLMASMDDMGVPDL